MLQDGAHLHFEADLVEFRMLRIAVGRLRDTADIMQRQVAETVRLVGFPLVDGILPVNFEETFQHRRHLADIFCVKGNYAQSYDIRNVKDVAVLVAFLFEFPLEGIFCLYAVLDSRHDKSGLFKKALQLVRNHLSHLAENMQQPSVLSKQLLHVRIN